MITFQQKMRARLFEGRAAEATVDQWLDAALEAEKTMKDVGIFDPAYEYFVRQRNYLLDGALAREVEDANL